MSFLGAPFLWALPLAALPVILHLLNKRPPQRIVFSYVKWLREAHESYMPRKKLRDLLLLILRTLMLLFLVLFFARPVFHQGSLFAARTQESSLIVLLDVSASMGQSVGGREALEMAKDQLKFVLRKLPGGTRVGFAAYSDRVEEEMALTAEKTRLLAIANQVKVVPRPTNVLPALELAYSMLSGQSRGKKTILVISDQAANGWEKALEKAGHWLQYDPTVGLIAWEIAESRPNTGVSSASLELNEVGLLRGRAMVHRIDASSTPSVWRLVLNKRVVEQGNLAQERTARAEIPLRAQLPEGGFYSGQLETQQDEYAFDDIYYLAGRVPKGFRLLVVDGEGGLAPSDSETYYLRQALESPRDPRLESIRVIRPELLAQERLDDYDAIVLANTAIQSGRDEDLLRWIERGGGLFLTAGSKWPKSREVPLKLFRSKASSESNLLVQVPAAGTPILSDVAGLTSFQWDQIQVNRYVSLETESVMTPLLLLSNGDPLLVRKQLGKGFILCLTTTIDRAWTNLPAKPIFAPLIRELIAALVDPLREQASLNGFVDEPLRIRVPLEVKAVTVFSPNGTSGGARVNKDGFLEWERPTLPGLYQVKTDRPGLDFSFAVNVRELDKEGQTSHLSSGELKDIFPEAPVEWVPYRGRSEESVLATLEGRDMTGMLMILVFLLFISETVLSWIWGKKAEQAA